MVTGEILEDNKQNKVVDPNIRQKECIYNTKTGKYLVLAGPGTGKTFTVTRKIKHMIEDEEVAPEKILCLTFSNTAAREMKTKIGDKYDVNVYTYHEFCLDIIEEFSEQFSLPEIKIITDSHKRTLVKECIDELNPKAYNNEKNNPYIYSQDILDGIEEIKKNRLSKTQFFDNLRENPMWEPRLKFLQEQESEKTKKSKAERESLEKKIAQMRELWDFYELYKKKMQQLNYIDFHDMINIVLEKFEDENSFLLEELASKFEYILVDEYQDTNKAQNDIVFNLAKYCPNVFVVGDDDQIIFTFQGANLDTIENFLNNFSDVRVVCLEENNRSTQTILDVSQEVAKLQDAFCRFMADKAKTKKDKAFWESNSFELRICSNPRFKNLNITKALISPKTSPVYDKKKPVEYYKFEKEQDERTFIIEQIKNLVNSQTCPKKLSEIAILTKTNDELKKYERFLKANGIPVEITGGKNIFDINSVNVLVTYMQFLVNPEMYSDKLLSFLLSQPFHIDPRDYKTLCDFKSHHRSLIENINNLLEKGLAEDDLKQKLDILIKSKSNTLISDIRNLLDNKSRIINDRQKLEDFVTTYEYLKNYISNENYANALIEIGNKTGIFKHYFNNNINQLENVKGIKKLCDEADAYFAVYTNQGCSFSHFVDYLTRMLESGVKINLDKEDKPLNAVQLSTYHSSKGREFEYVFMPSLMSAKWESSSSSSKDRIPLDAKGLTFEELEEKQLRTKFLDNIKLLYVGMTRAKHTLILSAIETGTREGKLSWFISQVIEKLKDRKDLIIIPQNAEVNILENLYSDYNYKVEFDEFIKSNLQTSYSPSSLNFYRKCPRQYLYKYILGLKSDSGNKDNIAYGLAVHKAFQFILEYAMKNRKYPACKLAAEVFLNSIDNLPSENPDKLKQSAEEYIFAEDKYFSKFVGLVPIENLETQAELPLDYLTAENISFNGCIDRIDKNSDGSYTIYDYKTGTDSTGITRRGIHSDYYYQIAFYKYLFKKQYEIDGIVKTCFLYPLIENSEVRIDITDEECEEIAQEFIEIVQRINNLEFDKPAKCPNEKYCDYKNFCKLEAV